MKSVTIKFIIIVINLSSFGCTAHYFNLNYPDNQQKKNFAIDGGYCTQVSYGSVPMPQVHINNNIGSTTTSGNVHLTGPNGNYQGRYNSTTTYNGNFVSGFADGMNIGSAIAANIDRSNVYDSCLARLGWFRVEGSTYLRPSLAFGADPGDNGLLAQKSIDSLISKGFIKPIYAKKENSYYLLKSDSIRNEGNLYYLTFAQIYPDDIKQKFPGTTSQGVPVAYKTFDYLVDTNSNRVKVLKIDVYNRDNDKIFTHNDSEMNSITETFIKTSNIDIYLNLYSKEYNPSASVMPVPSRFSIADSYNKIISHLKGQGYTDTLFDKASWSQFMINKDSIVKNGDKLSFSCASIYDVDRVIKKTATDTSVIFIAYYKFDYVVDIVDKRLKVIGYKAYNRMNEELLSHVNSDMEVTTSELAKTSIIDRYLKKHSPEYAAKSN